MKPNFYLAQKTWGVLRSLRSLRLFWLMAMLMSLSACSSLGGLFGNSPPSLPNGANRVAINGNGAGNGGVAANQGMPTSTLKRSSFVLESASASGVSGSAARVSLLDTLAQISANTGLQFIEPLGGMPDEALEIVTNDDPFDVLRQLAKKSRYRINLDREKGHLWASSESKQNGLFILRDAQPVVQVGSPITLKTMPKEPVSLLEALHVLSPEDFDVGHADTIDPNIRVDLKTVTSWLEGLESVANQTPYRIVFDWTKRTVYAVPAALSVLPALKKGF